MSLCDSSLHWDWKIRRKYHFNVKYLSCKYFIALFILFFICFFMSGHPAGLTFTVCSGTKVQREIDKVQNTPRSKRPITGCSLESKLNNSDAPAEKLNLPICRKRRWQETSQFATCAADNKPQPRSPASWEAIISKKECHAVLRCSRIKMRETASLRAIMRELETSFN